MVIEASHIGKTIGEPPTRILTDLSFVIADGDFVALTGRSGSGKSTLLYLISSLDTVSEGSIVIDGQNLSDLKPSEIARFRNEKIGFIFQFHYLINELSALENVLLPVRKQGLQAKYESAAQDLLERFGLKNKEHRLPRHLSGGEQQRVAIARALLLKPKYIFADEPTGSLDSVSGENVMQIISEYNQVWGATVILVTHERDFAALAKRQIHLVDGKMV